MSQRLATYNRVYTTRSCRQQCFYGIGATTENVLAAAVSNVSGSGDTTGDHEDARNFTSSLNRVDQARLLNYKILQQQIIGHTIQSVEDIEKWLRYTSENISNPVINSKNNVVQAGLEKSLPNEQHLSEASDKELLTDVELAAEKLNIDYDAILNELQSSKVLSANEKDDAFALPNLQLDDLILTQDMPTSESKTEGLTDKSQNNDVAKVVKTAHLKDKFESLAKNRQNKENETELINQAVEESIDATLTMCIQDLSIENDSSDGLRGPNIQANSNKSENSSSPVVTQEKSSRYNTRSKSTNSSNVKSKLESSSVKSKFEKNSSNVKSKFKPSIIKRKKKVNNQENTPKTVKNKRKVSTKTVLLEKFLNENNYTIRQKSSTSESSGFESDDVGKGRNPLFVTAQELAVSKALEEAGIPDGSLEYFYNAQNIKTWRCHLKGCGRHFAKLHYLKVHLMAHMNVKPFKCDTPGCSWAFCSEFKLKRHKKTHLNKKDFVCLVPGCQRRFTTNQNLAIHEKLHKRPNKIACQVSGCSAKFPTKRALESHLRSSHDEAVAPYVCNYDECGKRFYSNNALMSHQRCHSNSPEDLVCSWPGCGKTFDLPSRKKSHMRSHTAQKKSFACTFENCNWTFSTSTRLKRHRKKHTNERKYACDEVGCGKNFLRSEHLRDHKITHEPERKFFTCHYCSNGFYAKSSLYAHIKKHLRIMTGETTTMRPAKRQSSSLGSSECESTTSTEENFALPPAETCVIEKILPASSSSSDVLVHKIYRCPVENCFKCYSYRSSLRVHLRKHAATTLGESQNDEDLKSNEGAARTEFTREYVLSLKPERQVVDDHSNEVVGLAELSEGLLRDEVPSAFYQDDDDSSSYQIFIHDSIDA